MSIRVGFDVDGVIANFNKTFRDTAARIEETAGQDPAHPPTRGLGAAAMKRVWDHISRTPQWWLQLEAYEPEQIERIYRTSRERRWEVYFMTTRPSSAGETTQFQTQWWLEAHRFPMPAVLTVPGSRGEAANALKLDITVDDRLTNCVDIIAASRSKAILVLRREDQIVLDDLLTAAYKHRAAAAYAGHLLPFETFLLAMQIEDHREVMRLREEIDTLRGQLNQLRAPFP